MVSSLPPCARHHRVTEGLRGVGYIWQHKRLERAACAPSAQRRYTTRQPKSHAALRLDLSADTASAFVFDAGTSLADVVDAINAIGTTSADLVAILEALRAAGALRAQMIII